MIRKPLQFSRRPAPPQIALEDLGRFSWHRSIWHNEGTPGRAPLLMGISGTPEEPDPKEVEKLRRIWLMRDALFVIAEKYLRDNEPLINGKPLRAYGIDPGGGEGHENFMLEMVEPDEIVVWRVIFEHGLPVNWGFDD